MQGVCVYCGRVREDIQSDNKPSAELSALQTNQQLQQLLHPLRQQRLSSNIDKGLKGNDVGLLKTVKSFPLCMVLKQS